MIPTIQALPPEFLEAFPPEFLAALPPGSEVLVLSGLNVAEAERLMILRALERTANNRTAAAALLGMHPRTLRRKLRTMQLAPDEPEHTGG